MISTRSGIQCRGVTLVRRNSRGVEKTVLSGIDATFGAGSISVICGPTGAGKSSLLHIMAGLIRPTEGVVIAGGAPISRWISPHRDRWRRCVGIVFQRPCLIDGLTAFENVILPILPRKVTFAEMRRRGERAMDRLGVRHLAGEPVESLSGGERQMVALARAMIGSPLFVFADEPTAHQDTDGTRRIRDTLRDACRREATVIVAAHDQRLTRPGFADAVYRIRNMRLEPMR
jgi:ABC-type lipoprotein export system ATPase subunit